MVSMFRIERWMTKHSDINMIFLINFVNVIRQRQLFLQRAKLRASVTLS